MKFVSLGFVLALTLAACGPSSEPPIKEQSDLDEVSKLLKDLCVAQGGVSETRGRVTTCLVEHDHPAVDQ